MTGPRPYPTLPVLLGADDTIGPALASLTDTIGSLINPNAKFQHAMRAMFIEKPELMQTFVDIEKANPGTLKAFGFGEAGTDLLSGMQESIPALKARVLAPKIAEELQAPNSLATRSAVTKGISGQTPEELAAGDFSSWFVKEGRKMLESDPELFVRAARAKYGTGTQLEQTLEEEALVNIRNIQDLYGKGVPEIQKMLKSGELTAEVISAGLSNPRTAPAMKLAIEENNAERDNTMRMYLARFGRGADDPLARVKLASTIEAWERAGKRGSIGGWYSHMWNSDEFGKPEAGDAEAITLGLKNAAALEAIQRSQALYRAIEPTVGKLRGKGTKKLTAEETAAEVSRLNATLRELGSNWTAEWHEDDPWWRGPKNKLIFIDGQGNITDKPEDLITPIAPMGAPNVSQMRTPLTPDQRMMLNYLRGITDEGERSRYLETIRARDAGQAERLEMELTSGAQ